MISLAEARQIAERFLDVELRARFPHEIVILQEWVEDQGDAWIFPYNGRGFVERDDFNEIMAGNTPIAVNKETGLATFKK